MYYNVLVANKYANEAYTYESTEIIKIGTIVLVEFSKKKIFGICLEKKDAIKDNTTKKIIIKPILEIYEKKVSLNFLEFAKYCGEYNLVSIGSVLELAFCNFDNKKEEFPLLLEKDQKIYKLDQFIKPGFNKKHLQNYNKANLEQKFTNSSKIILNENQMECANKISNTNKTIFLEGSTGSGKTLTALEGIKKHILVNRVLKKKLLIITPEISLAKNWARVIEEYFGIHSFLYHYKVSNTYKKSVFEWAVSNEPGIIIGARSALFLPYQNLSAIIVDEEHSSSLKQERYPFYQGRDMAVLKAHFEKAVCVLLSATPSLETIYNVEVKKYDYAKITRQQKLGKAKCVFFKVPKFQILAQETIAAINEVFARNEQVFLFLNRRGYSPYCICNECNNFLKCAACDVPLVLYVNGSVVCHKCFKTSKLPTSCVACKKNVTWKFFGMGVEKLKEAVEKLFPQKNFQIITSDTKDVDEYVQAINEKKIDAIIATQVLAQGHDFKNIALIVIVDANMGINSPDFRASEKMYQLWEQIRGRSNRHECEGKIIIQEDDNKFVQLFKNENAYELLMDERKANNWPPFSRCGFIIIKSKDSAKIKEYFSNNIFGELRKNNILDVANEFYGPLYAGKKNFVLEWRFLIKVPKDAKLNQVMKKISNLLPKTKGIKVEFEIDPYNFFS